MAIPTLIIVGLMVIPYLDTSRHATGRYTFSTRRLAIGHFLFGFGFWWVLIAIGQLLRGPNCPSSRSVEDRRLAGGGEPASAGLAVLAGGFQPPAAVTPGRMRRVR